MTHYVSRVLKFPKKCLEDLTTFFMSTWWGDSKNMEEIEFSRWLFEGRLRQCKNVLPDGLNWLCYFAGSSKSHRENSISFMFLESPHQVDMRNVVKSSQWLRGITVMKTSEYMWYGSTLCSSSFTKYELVRKEN